MFEETGLHVEPLEAVEIFESIGAKTDSSATYHFVVIDYVCLVTGGTLKAADDALAAQWFSRFELPEHITKGAPEVIEKAFRAIPRDTLKA